MDNVEVILTIEQPPSVELETAPAALDVGALDVGTVVPMIPSNYGLITWDGNTLTVS